MSHHIVAIEHDTIAQLRWRHYFRYDRYIRTTQVYGIDHEYNERRVNPNRSDHIHNRRLSVVEYYKASLKTRLDRRRWRKRFEIASSDWLWRIVQALLIESMWSGVKETRGTSVSVAAHAKNCMGLETRALEAFESGNDDMGTREMSVSI